MIVKKGKGSLHLLLVVALSVLLLAGCGSSNESKESGGSASAGKENGSETQQPEGGQNKQVTLNILFPGDPPKDMDAVNAAIEQKMLADGLNMKLKFTYVPWDSYWNKQSLAVAAGEAYDLTWSHVSHLPESVAKKVLMPIDELLASDGQGLLESVPDYVWKAAKVNGATYAIPRSVPTADSTGMNIRGDLRKKYNLPEIKTTADFEAYLKAVRAGEPDIGPMEAGQSGMMRELAPGYYTDGAYSSFYYVDVTKQPLKFENFFESDAFQAYADKVREWYLNGYLPKDPANVKDPEGDFDNGKSPASWAIIMKPTERIDSFKNNLPDGELEYVFLHPDQPKYIFYTADNLLAVLASSKQPEAAVAFVNWMKASQENYDLFTYGVKDVNYKLDGSSVSYEGIPADKQYQTINWAWTDLRYHRFSKHLTEAQLETIKTWDEGAIKTPLIGFTLDSEPVKSELAKIIAVMTEYKNPIDSGIVDFSSVKEKFLNRLKDAGIDKVLAEYQRQLDQYLAAQN